MADWRQIQARIRKAKASADAPTQLAVLYERTRDAMVAFELARLQEKSGQNEEAIRWYTVAAERFRRAQWRTKATEALTRMGAPIPLPGADVPSAPAQFAPAAPEVLEPDTLGEAHPPGPGGLEEQTAERPEPPAEAAVAEAEAQQPAPERARRRRRGKRGGRRRGKKARTASPPEAATPSAIRAEEVTGPPAPERRAEAGRARGFEPEPPTDFRPVSGRVTKPPRVAEVASPPPAWQARARAGEPALASRLAHLESQLRRLIASPLYRVKDADQAPAGPGVFILSDTDQTTYYDIQACQTLRIGIGNLLRTERGARKGESFRARLADHLGIPESRVSKYLNDHCAVRWLQLDEGAALLAHFAIAVLRPALND